MRNITKPKTLAPNKNGFERKLSLSDETVFYRVRWGNCTASMHVEVEEIFNPILRAHVALKLKKLRGLTRIDRTNKQEVNHEKK